MPAISQHDPTKVFFLLMLLLLLTGGTLIAESAPYCASLPRLQWLSAEEVEARLRKRGFNLVRLRLADDKCYRVVVRDSGGRLHDLLMHPVTAEIVGERDL